MNAIVISAIWGVVMMFSGIFSKNNAVIRGTALTGLALLIVVNVMEMGGTSLFKVNVHGMLYFDSFSLLFNTIAFGSTFLYTLLSGRDMDRVGRSTPDYFALIFFILCGVAISSSFNSLLMLFLGIEIMSIPLYILTGTDKRNLKSNEAALKYFLMGSFSTGIMLMGITLLYGAKGSFNLEAIALGTGELTPMVSAGLLLLLVAMGFKVSAAPFHFWTPDVYDGAPTVFTSFMATVIKSAGFIAFLRLFDDAFGEMHAQWQLVVAVVTAATLIIGNITAVFQQSVKRMLAYSSIAQAGFMLFALVALNELSRQGLIFYTAAYSVATIGIFAVLIKMKDYTFEGFNGLAKRQPVLAATAAIFLLSLAGIPGTAGFMAKFYMLAGAVANGHVLWLVIVGILCAAISIYYYFRVIQAMYFKEGDAQEMEVSGTFKALLVLLAAIVVVLGIFPQCLLDKLYYFF
ncbi:NADH-quinone oxidoreductase subunit N [Paraflavitalea sp. CAU 1676]|uniref:NADH-quinone oxidoreductase subunit N n=1 Tax=Paraflavitalea sp. CAU 1676 TaxID=3032598 RepID=UPI0023D9A247|nr:NADH-quinone oxidoreductase subunit N [Paraflavitalea sp. CAU 1676]MDF2192975.1 NADH-quinone oxidoreductase subunit N [Paraflavitalea sp. CAU 1676]